MRKNFVIYSDGDEFSSENVKNLEKALDGFVSSNVKLAVEIVFVDGDEIRRLNNDNRGIDRVTDVLSFPALDEIKGLPLKKQEKVLLTVNVPSFFIETCYDAGKRNFNEKEGVFI